MTTSAARVRNRIVSVDILRGLVMILMALDHIRDFFAPTASSPEALDDPGMALFLTRWITHFCAPVFVFLAGTSAWLYQQNTGSDIADLRRFLWTRGLWLVAVEILIVNPSWPYILDGILFVQVIAVIGWSMILLALLLPLGPRLIGLLGLVMVFGHNLLDGIEPAAFGAFASLWQFLHVQGGFPVGEGWFFFFGYPLLPWPGIMFLGYAFGEVLSGKWDIDWRAASFRTGLAATLAFLLLRFFNLYGEPSSWAAGNDLAGSIISFLNTEKYPPSLQYVLMTLGPALMAMPLLENWRGRLADMVTVFGRVPFFYYVLHVPLMYLLAIIHSEIVYGASLWWMRGTAAYPDGYELNLWVAYGAWLVVLAMLYPACRWYAAVKKRRKDWWLSYL